MRNKTVIPLIVFLTAVSPVFLVSQVLTEDDICLHKDVVYSVVDGHELRLDIAVPKYLRSPAPVIVDIPGGAWRVIHKSSDDAVWYATYGFVGVSILHRTSDMAVFPAAVHDCKTVIRWLRAHAEQYNINPDRIGVTGFSSGGHLAALLGTSGGDPYLEGEGPHLEFSSRVQAVVDHFGPTDFLQANETDLEDTLDHSAEDSPECLFLGGSLEEKADLARLANPIQYIDPKDPPTFIGHGDKDRMVPISQSELLYEALKKAGVSVELVRVKNADHMYRPSTWDAEVSPSVAEMNDMTIEWFKKWLGEPDMDLEAVKKRKIQPKVRPSARTPLYYKITVDLPGKTEKSYLEGRFSVRCEGQVLAQGEIHLTGLSDPENRTFYKDLILTGPDLTGKKIMWNFQGQIYDSQLDEIYEVMYMWGVEYDPSIKGVGYHFQIDEDKSFHLEKLVFRKKMISSEKRQIPVHARLISSLLYNIPKTENASPGPYKSHSEGSVFWPVCSSPREDSRSVS